MQKRNKKRVKVNDGVRGIGGRKRRKDNDESNGQREMSEGKESGNYLRRGK